MKRINILLTIILAVTATTSCDQGFLDQVPDDRLTLKDVFVNRTNTEAFLANVYSNIPDEFAQRFVTTNNSGPWTSGSDEAKYVWGFVASNQLNAGSWNSSSGFVRAFWLRYYQGIRNAGYFIANADQCSECSEQLLIQFKAEARALRAMFYYYLMRLYGPVVVLGEDVIPPDAPLDQIQIPRSPFDECVDYVVSELDAAAADLPVMPTNNTAYGRITRGIALSFKLETLMLAASPLFNGNTDYADLKNNDGTQLISQQYDANKWKRAADAANEFIDQFVPGTYNLYKKNNASGVFDPYLSCRDVMLDDWNSEWIFARPGNLAPWRQYETTPYHSGAQAENRGSGGLGATQNMVDAYFTANGRPIDDPASGYASTGFSDFKAPYDFQARQTYNQWANREPRFYVGVTYDGSLWLNRSSGDIVTRTHFSGNSGVNIGGNDYSRTGYIVRKNMPVADHRVGGRALVLSRLAHIYLNYVEALNEYDPGNPDILIYLNLIRERAGIPAYGSDALPEPFNQDAMREAIRRERRIELAFENVRFFDTRRWKIAEQTDNGPIYGLNIQKDAPEFYTKVAFENRLFQKKHYLFPIPQIDVNINKQLIQNTGW